VLVNHLNPETLPGQVKEEHQGEPADPGSPGKCSLREVMVVVVLPG